MINHIQLLRGVGQFESVDAGKRIALAPLTFVYAENGRGKTTLAAVLRSLATGDPLPIVERRRLAYAEPQLVVLACAGALGTVLFEKDRWTQQLPRMAVFDDTFVDRNLYSGLAVATEHRQNLHELILGAEGVTLNKRLQQLVDQAEAHNPRIRERALAIPFAERGPYSVDDFCALKPHADIAAAVQDAERAVAASRERARILKAPDFPLLDLRRIRGDDIEAVLAKGLKDIDQGAAERVRQHLQSIGGGSEDWVAEGVRRNSRATPAAARDNCPFCAQSLAGSPIFGHFRAYFGQEYRQLADEVAGRMNMLGLDHDAAMEGAFERTYRAATEQRAFWRQFCEVPEFDLDTAVVSQARRAAVEAMAAELENKRRSLLEPAKLSTAAKAALAAFEERRLEVEALNEILRRANKLVAEVKANAGKDNLAELELRLRQLRAVRARHTPEIAVMCKAYEDEKQAKDTVVAERDRVRAELDKLREAVFPRAQAGVNKYLERFGAGFHLERVAPANVRGGSVCNYDVVINGTAVPVAGGEEAAGHPGFRNTLSAGDRNTLALAFFFAALDSDPELGKAIVVIDDPVSSLDDHRQLTTVQEIRDLSKRAAQVIVLSHSKPFLCQLWEGVDVDRSAALEVVRAAKGSTLASWDVNRDSVSEHDRRHEKLRAYAEAQTPNGREVAEALRFVLEAFLRVAYPDHFRPGKAALGDFLERSRQRLGKPDQILSPADTEELAKLSEYAHRFHHETNPLGWRAAQVSDNELLPFVRRILRFTRR